MPTSQNKDVQTFAAEFLSLARKRRTGTFQAIFADGARTDLLLQDGLIVDLDTHTENTLLVQVLLATGKVSDRELRRARKESQKGGAAPLGAFLLGQIAVNEEDLFVRVKAALADAICALFAATLQRTAFIDHAADERIEGFGSELSQVMEISADPEDLFIEAARRLGRWDLVEAEFGILREVLYATPGAARYFRDPESYPAAAAILGLIDGRNDVSEVVVLAVEAHGDVLDQFAAVSTIRTMVAGGELDAHNPVQLFQLAVEFQEGERFEKALRLFTRAAERGLDDFDVDRQIAQCHEALGHRAEAARRFHEFGLRCVEQHRTDDALRSLKKAIGLDPKRREWQEKLLELLLKGSRRSEALPLGLDVAARLAEAGEPQAALDLLRRMEKDGVKDEKLSKKIIELAERCGEESTRKSQRERLAGEFLARKETEKALAVYQQMFFEGNASLEVRLKLIDLHHEKGNRQSAVEHIVGVLSLGDAERVKDPAVLKRLNEKLSELRPGDARSSRWLVDFHLRNHNRDAALGILRTQAAQAEQRGDYYGQVRALRQISVIDAENREPRWQLAKVFDQAGKTAESIQELRGVAQLSVRRQDAHEAERAFSEILRLSPFEAEVRKSLGELVSSQGDAKRAAVHFREAGSLFVLAGKQKEAQASYRRALDCDPTEIEGREKLAEVCRGSNGDPGGVEETVKLAQIYLEKRDLGRARESAAAALKLKAGQPEAQEVLRAVEELEAKLKAPRAPAPTPAAPVVAAVAAPMLSAGPAAPALPAPSMVAAAHPPLAAVADLPSQPTHEPFQPSAPVVKKSVAGITARLRGMKSGAPTRAEAGDGGAPAEGGKQIRTNIGSVTQRLKALGSKGLAAAAATAAAPPPDGAAPAAFGETAAPTPTAGGEEESIKMRGDPAELERLREALQGSAPSTASDAPDPSASSPGASAPGAPSKALGKSAAVLARLRKAPAPSSEAQPQPEKNLG